ncbi:MAG: two-component system NtrC family sensor kinase [Candidatus Latescibacterota bacterium]|jgi:two-component system NtrC family sensor kinase
MELSVTEKRLIRTQEKLAAMEKLLEDKSRELFQANEKIQDNNEYLENIFAAMQSCLIVTDAQGIVQVVNEATLYLLGYDMAELVGQPLSLIDVKDNGEWGIYRNDALDRATPRVRQEVKYRAKSGAEVPVLFSSSVMHDTEGALTGIVYSALDLSNYKQLERQLLLSEKMASIGQLAAGVAHEINNPMSFIFSNLSTLKDYVEDITSLLAVYEKLENAAIKASIESIQPEIAELEKAKKDLEIDYLLADIRDLVEESSSGAVRVQDIVINLKQFSHTGHDEKTLENLNEGLESTISIVWNELKYKVSLEKNYGEIPGVLCFPQEVNQVFMNLLVNAGQAIEDSGEIKVRTYEEEEYVCVDLADTGKGMSPEMQSRVFEPFFTTKDIGEGTGLGLSVSYQIIVEKHGGLLLVDSKEGSGTTFTVKLPK